MRWSTQADGRFSQCDKKFDIASLGVASADTVYTGADEVTSRVREMLGGPGYCPLQLAMMKTGVGWTAARLRYFAATDSLHSTVIVARLSRIDFPRPSGDSSTERSRTV